VSEQAPITLATLAVGHGNPFAQKAAVSQFEQHGQATATLVVNNPLVRMAALVHGRVTRNEKLRNQYEQGYEAARVNPITQLIGLLALLQISREVKRRRSQTLILTQELPLTAYQTLKDLEFTSAIAALANLQQIFLLIPDVEAKSTAVTAVNQLKNQLPIEALVWNQQASAKLKEKGVPHQLIAPWLLARPVDFATLGQTKPRAAVKPSGSGIDPEHLAAIPALVQQYNPHLHGFDIFTRQGSTQHDRQGKQLLNWPNRFSSLIDVYMTMVQANPALIISHPSEMVQLMVQAYLTGYKGEHGSLPSRGAHERINLAFAMALGITSEITLENGLLKLNRPTDERDLEKIRAALGQRSLVETVRIPPFT
jgi:hypothetical protein